MRPKTPRWLVTPVVCLLASWGSVAQAQNADPFFYGDEAALSAGAVVASGRDSGAFWYNPAGFGGLQRGMVSGSASTFGVRVRTLPNALSVVSGGREAGSATLSSVDIISVPNAIVFAANLTDRVAAAAGLLVTQRDVRSALGSIPADALGQDAQGRPFTFNERLDAQNDRSKYHFGPAVGIALTPSLRIGFSLFGTYAKTSASAQYALSGEPNPNPGGEHDFITVSARATESIVGVTGAAGVQWEASRRVTLGLTVRAPELGLLGSIEGGGIVASAVAGGGVPAAAAIQVANPPSLSPGGVVVVPARVLAGVAYAIGPRESWVEAGVDFAHGLPRSSVGDAEQAQINGRLGLRTMLSPEWIVGGGVFTDRATTSLLGAAILADRVDYYGLTAGVSKRTPLALVKNPSPEALVLVTTLSLRAAVGFGEARALAVDLVQSNAPPNARVAVTFAEIMPYLGSTVLF